MPALSKEELLETSTRLAPQYVSAPATALDIQSSPGFSNTLDTCRNSDTTMKPEIQSETEMATHTVTNSGIEVRPADGNWDDYVERSEQGTAFHREAFLDVVADHADATLHRLVGFKGQEPVGVFPVFELTKGFTTAVFSPPPDLGLSQMGPALLNLDKLKQRKRETRTRRFLEGCLSWIDERLDPSFVHVRSHYRYEDYRPFAWNGFDITPRYTYVLDLEPGPDALMDGFSSDARRNVRRADETDVVITERGRDAIGEIVSHLQDRHDAQDVHYPVDPGFVADLDRALPEGQVRTYVASVDGDYVGGMVTLEDETTVFRWQGGARPKGDASLPVNDLLDWRIITDAVDRGRTRYDFVGANTPHLCEYKSKFGPDLVSYAVAERSTTTMRMVSRLYRSLR